MLRGCGDTHGTKGCWGLIRGSGQTPLQVTPLKWSYWIEVAFFCLSIFLFSHICGYCLILNPNKCRSIWASLGFRLPYQWRIFFKFILKQTNKRKWIHINTIKAILFPHTAAFCRCLPAAPDSEPCSIMLRQRPHPTSPVPSKPVALSRVWNISPWQISL